MTEDWKCEHGIVGCLMPGLHMPSECHTAEMMEDQERNNVVTLDVSTSLDIPVDRVLDGMKKADLDAVVVIGYTKDGELVTDSSNALLAEINLMLDRAKDHYLHDAEIV